MYRIRQGKNEWIVTDYQVKYQSQVAILEAITENGRALLLFGSFSIEECKQKKKAKKKK